MGFLINAPLIVKNLEAYKDLEPDRVILKTDAARIQASERAERDESEKHDDCDRTLHRSLLYEDQQLYAKVTHRFNNSSCSGDVRPIASR